MRFCRDVVECTEMMSSSSQKPGDIQHQAPLGVAQSLYFECAIDIELLTIEVPKCATPASPNPEISDGAAAHIPNKEFYVKYTGENTGK